MLLEHDSIRSDDGNGRYYFDKVHDVASRRELSRLNRRCNRSRNFRARTSPSRDYPRLGKGDPPRNSRRQLALYQTTSLTQSYNSHLDRQRPILLGTTTNEPARANMAKQVTCDCGFMLRTPSDDELVKHVQLHAKDTHSIDLTPEQALARAVSVEATIQA